MSVIATFPARLDALLTEAAALAAEMECTTPANGYPGIAHCAACCGGTHVNASCQEELDLAYALDSLVRTGRKLQELTHA